jgi:hypothetical protein
MDNGVKNHLFMQIGLVGIMAIFIGGYVVTPSYGKTIHFEEPFESSLIPLCGPEDVIFSGILKFVFHETTDNDGNLRQKVHVYYVNVHGVGVTTGTQYTVHDNEHITLQEEGSDTTVTTLVRGSMISNGQDINTHVKIRLVTVMDENGNFETIVDDTDIKCNG